MKLITLLIAFLFLPSGHYSQDKARPFFDKADVFFDNYVSDSQVDYSRIKNHPQLLDSLLMMAKVIRVDVNDAKTYKAFWINAYNLATIKGVVNRYPIKSVRDVVGFFDSTSYEIGGKVVTLNEIENKLLRAEFHEPRFHFVLVCAALSCPPIINKSYRPETLEEQLQEQTILSLNNPEFVKLESNKVFFSRIMEWYYEDFTENGQSLIQFTNNYRVVKIPENLQVDFYTYDWSLNEN